MTQNNSEAPRDTTGEILADLLAVASGDAENAGAAVDETIIMAQPVREASDHTVVVNQVAEVAEDRTIIVSQPVHEASDHTVVVNQSAPEVSDHTVVVNQPLHADDLAAVSAPDESVDEVGDGTVVVPAAAEAGSPSRRDRRERGEAAAQAATGSDPAPPVDAPREKRSLRRIVGGGLDPRRPIAEAPGSAPWETQSAGERGVAQGLPVSYGARVQTDMPLEVGIDEVQRRVGPAPEASHVEVVQGRDLLPSLQRRDRKRSLITLLVYAGLTALCIFGLWGVASIAFG